MMHANKYKTNYCVGLQALLAWDKVRNRAYCVDRSAGVLFVDSVRREICNTPVTDADQGVQVLRVVTNVFLLGSRSSEEGM